MGKEDSTVASSLIPLMINGLPGQMATETLAAAARQTERYLLLPWSLTGPKTPSQSFIGPAGSIRLIAPADAAQALVRLKQEHPQLIVVDYTQPDALLPNGRLYRQAGLPFVMGTTGGERDTLLAELQQAGHPAIIAPNMALPIVAFQAIFAGAAERFPGVFSPFTLRIVESHQAGKLDTSGTARALAESFRRLGCDFSIEQIEKIRNPDAQIAFGVPASALGGHAYHHYSLESDELEMDFSFQHNVRGRAVYAAGTLEAVRTLRRWLDQGRTGGPWDMIAVLEDLR